MLLSSPEQKQKHSHFKNFGKYFSKLLNNISPLIANILILLIQLIRPLFGPQKICPFTIGCTEYAIMQLQTQPIYTAIANITIRLLRCNPISNIFKKETF